MHYFCDSGNFAEFNRSVFHDAYSLLSLFRCAVLQRYNSKNVLVITPR